MNILYDELFTILVYGHLIPFIAEIAPYLPIHKNGGWFLFSMTHFVAVSIP